VEGVEDGGRRVRHQQHVRLADVLEAADGGAVEAHAGGQQVLLELARGDREVLPGPGEVGELEVHQGDAVLARERHHPLRVRRRTGMQDRTGPGEGFGGGHAGLLCRGTGEPNRKPLSAC
jgi:hypothetical protein